MARRTTDLLDVFRAETPAPGRAATHAAAKAAGPKRRFEGLFLFPRQLLLGSCVVVLLLVFTFVLGLSMGRRGAAGGSSALQASAPRAAESNERRHYAVGRVPHVDAARQARIDPAALRDRLVENYGVPRERIWILNDADARQWQVVLGPFANEHQATEFLFDHTLIKARLGSGAPFENATYRRWRPSDLPAERLPTNER